MSSPDAVSTGQVYTLMAAYRPRRSEADPRWVVNAEHAKPSDPLPMYVTVTWPDPDADVTDDPIPTVITLFTLGGGGVAYTVDGGVFADGVCFDLSTAIHDALAAIDVADNVLQKAA